MARRSRAGLLLLLAASCAEPDDAAPALADTVTRERAVATFVADRQRAADALELLRPLVERRDARVSDLVLAASLALQDSDLETAREVLARVRRGAAGDPAVRFLRARIAALEGDAPSEIAHLRAVLDGAPDDVPAKLLLGAALVASDGGSGPERDRERAEARGLLEEVLSLGPDNGLGWYASAVFQLLQLAIRVDDADAIRRFEDLHRSLDRRGLRVARMEALNQGWLARIAPPPPRGSRVAGPPRAPEYAEGAAILPELGSARELTLRDLDGDHVLDFVTCGADGLFVTQRGQRPMIARRIHAGDVRLVRPFDVDDAGDTLDLLFVEGASLRLLEQSGGAWQASSLALPTFPAPPADLLLVDFDHDGDLDVLVVGPFGARLLRNDGAARLRDGAGKELPRGRFVEVGAQAGLPESGAFTWCRAEDFDGDQDVDLLLGGPERLFLASNLRGGHFEELTSAVFDGVRIPRAPLVADFDGDARPDLFAPGAGGAPSTLWMQGRDGQMTARATDLVVPDGAAVIGVDCDLDGALDVLWPAEGCLAEGALAVGQPFETPVRLGSGFKGGGLLAAGDLDFGPGTANTIELVAVVPDGVHVARVIAGTGGGVRFKLAGRKDNRQAVGAVLEVRAGALYRRVYWHGPAVVVGVGGEQRLDVVRITWPNGVVQSMLDVALGDHFPPREEGLAFEFDTTGATTPGVAQEEGLAGSCPFLYTWNGTTFEFVTDVLGVAPLGLPMAPGQLVPPDHDELVLVRGDQLAQRAGMLELQITEELREVTYLDRIRLDVIDHRAGTEIYPNERFQFPPFPEPLVHVVRVALPPVRATDDDGTDWTAALARIDGVYAVPFRPLPPQFQGLAAPHRLELAFDPALLAHAGTLRLLCTGWFDWSNASVNMAAARTPGVDFVPPTLEVPDGAGGWVPAGPPVGFPAGKTKTMVLDVTDILARDDPRLRIFSTLQLRWDSIRLALDVEGAEAELRVTALEPASARLAWRGFSAPLAAERPDQPERFVWGTLARQARWDQHPGRYTRYGEVLPLVTAIDDRFVIMGAGDALHVLFDARSLPPVPAGFTRDYLLFLDGWAKDRDPNTLEALEVEPLPFHGMSGYPYGPGERFPDDPAHTRWRREWNTRPAYRSIVPLSPVREREWAQVR